MALCIFAVIFSCLLLCDADVLSIWELNDAIIAYPADKVPYIGFITPGYDSVAYLFNARMQPIYYKTVDEISLAVLNGTVIAGMSANSPNTFASQLNQFGSGSIVTRACAFKKGADPDLQLTVNSAVVRVGISAEFRLLKRKYFTGYGINTVDIQTCAFSPNVFYYPTKYRNAVLKVGAWGPFDWAGLGNYVLSEPTGLFPDYQRLLQNELFKNLNITLQRVFYPTSPAVVAAADAGQIDFIESYWTVPANYNNTLPRIAKLDFSCAIHGTDNVFFTKKSPDAPGSSAVLSNGGIAGIIAGGIILLLILSLALWWVIHKERSGEPIFTPLREVHTAPTVPVRAHPFCSETKPTENQ